MKKHNFKFSKKKIILFVVLLVAFVLILFFTYFFFLSSVPVDQVFVKTMKSDNYYMELKIENRERSFLFQFDIDQANGIQKVDSIISNSSSETFNQYYLDYLNEDMYLVSDESVTRLDTYNLSNVTTILQTLSQSSSKKKIGTRTYEFTIPKDNFTTQLIDKGSVVCGYGTCDVTDFTDAIATVKLSIFGYVSSITFESGELSFTYTFEKYGNVQVTLPDEKQMDNMANSSNVSVDTGEIIKES